MVTAFTKHAAIKGRSYRPPDRTDNITEYTDGVKSGEQFALYLPTGSPSDYTVNSKPINGAPAHPDTWAYVVSAINTTFATSTPDFASTVTANVIDDNFGVTTNSGGTLWQCLMNGIAVVQAQVTAMNTTNSGGTVPNGFGYFHAPGGTNGFYESLNFRVVGVLRNFYKQEGLDGVDAIMYGRDL